MEFIVIVIVINVFVNSFYHFTATSIIVIVSINLLICRYY